MNLTELLPWIFIGVTSGIFVGAVPGLTGAMVIALTVPLTFSMDQDAAMALLVSLYTGSVSGGLISATLLNIPGTPAAMITILDAYPMTQRGEAGRALNLAVGASFIGGSVSGVALLFLSRPIAEWSVHLSPFDLFALVAMAMVFIASVSEPGTAGLGRGILSGMLGCLVALPGLHPATGQIRYTFGIEELSDGFRLLPVLIGLFAFGQAFRDLVSTGKEQPQIHTTTFSNRAKVGLKTWIKQAGNMVRSSLIGTGIGILPGIGANIGSTIAYGSAKNFSKAPQRFGNGSDEGLVASESANNATVGGALIPLVSLGIPGSVVDAVLLGAFVIHGLQPGPLLFENHPETVDSLIVSYLISNLFMVLIMLASARWIARLASISKIRLAPVIIVCCVIGCFALGNRMFDVWVMIGFGFLGLLLQYWRIPLAPFVIGFVLAPLAEENLASGLMASGGSYLPLVTRPFALTCLIATIVLLYFSVRNQKKAAPPVSDGTAS